MKRIAALLWVLAVPAGATAQGLSLRPPSMGEALDSIDRWAATHPSRDLRQTFVVPERPGQNLVAWYDFQWRHYDTPAPGGGPGGLRLYYYARERQVAERALPVIRSAFARLVDQFHYSPTKQIPYILYSSQREFQTTNVFEVSESVLGVTSPRDLKMTVPYFGDHEKFREVSTHEMVHQFTIQKLLDLAGAEEVGSLVEMLPLWYVEGIAEYYSKGGMDAETDNYLRDLVWNPDPERHYEVIPFAEDRYRGYIPTYKLGQARIAFIADVYGKEKIQAYIENAYLMGGGGASERGFAALTRRVLGESLEQVDARWHGWLKKRYYPEYLRIRQDLPQIRDLQEVPTEVEAYVVSPDGSTLFARGIDREQGRARLYVIDARSPRSAIEIATDNQPGIESLHPIEQNILAISGDHVAFTAQDGPSDSLYLQAYRYQPQKKGPPVLQVGFRRKLAIVHPAGLRFFEMSDPAFSPDGKQIAFIALTERGQRDVYVVGADGGTARQVTDDVWDERDLSWGRDGLYCTSDATEHGRTNLFRIDPATGARTRLTTAPFDDHYPRPQPDGTILFSSDRGGKPDVYRLDGAQIRRISDFSTGLVNPGLAASGRGIYAQAFYKGRFRLVEVPRVAWLEEPSAPVLPAAGPALGIPEARIPADVPEYRPYSLSNWRPEAGIIYGGGGAGAIAGRAAVLFSDMLRDHVLYLDLAVYGSFDYTQGLALFEDRSRRNVWAVGLYHFVQQQIDTLDPTLTYFQRDFGMIGTLRFPLNRFQRVDVELALGGVQRYCLTDEGVGVVFFCEGLQVPHSAYPTSSNWASRNGGVNPIVTPTLRYGYDTVRYDMAEGPIDGSALMLELGGSVLPTRAAVTGFGRLEASRFWRLIGRSKFFLRLAGGSSFAPNDESRIWARTWWLTSADNLRGFYPLDLAYLVGQNYYVANAELHLPLSGVLRLLFFDYIAGVVALDFGGVFNHWQTVYAPGTQIVLEPGAWEARTLTGVLGFNVLFGPLLLRVHFGHPFNIGGQLTPALLSGTRWVTNVTLRYFFF